MSPAAAQSTKRQTDESGGPFDGADDPAATVPDRANGVPTDPNDILFPESVPGFKFENVGDSVEGVIVKMEGNHQTDITSGEKLYWDDGRPRMQVVFTLATGLLDPEVEDDDGRRRLFVKSDMMRAVRDAVKVSGRRKAALGAHLAVRYAENGVPPRRGLSAPKLYQAIYTPVRNEEPL